MKSFAVISANTESDLQGSGTNSSQLARNEVNTVASSCPRSTTTWKVGKGGYFCYVLVTWAQVAQKAPRTSILEVMPVQLTGSHLVWLWCAAPGLLGTPSCPPPWHTLSLHFTLLVAADMGEHQGQTKRQVMAALISNLQHRLNVLAHICTVNQRSL